METKVLSNSLDQSEVDYAIVRTDALERCFEGEDAKKLWSVFRKPHIPKWIVIDRYAINTDQIRHISWYRKGE